MSKPQRTPKEIREAGVTALRKALGVADSIRFLQQFDQGSGDYTAERHRLLGNPSVADLVKQLKQRRARKNKRRT